MLVTKCILANSKCIMELEPERQVFEIIRDKGKHLWVRENTCFISIVFLERKEECIYNTGNIRCIHENVSVVTLKLQAFPRTKAAIFAWTKNKTYNLISANCTDVVVIARYLWSLADTLKTYIKALVHLQTPILSSQHVSKCPCYIDYSGREFSMQNTYCK